MSATLKHNALNRKGFTLVELLVVVVILAILAAIVVPQFTSSTDDAKVASLKANLSNLRGAIELYAVQHNGRYPGEYTDAATPAAITDATAVHAAFLAQLTKYTDKNGTTCTAKSTTCIYGPYLKTSNLPSNPFTSKKPDEITGVISATDNLTLTANGDTGWMYSPKSGKLIANDGTTGMTPATSTY